MKFLVDHQLPPALAHWLRGRGHDAVHVRDVELRDDSDAAIVAHAERHAAVIVTKDEDFAEMHVRGVTHVQIVWVRIGNATNRVLLAHCDRSWAAVEAALDDGLGLVELH